MHMAQQWQYTGPLHCSSLKLDKPGPVAHFARPRHHNQTHTLSPTPKSKASGASTFYPQLGLISMMPPHPGNQQLPTTQRCRTQMHASMTLPQNPSGGGSLHPSQQSTTPACTAGHMRPRRDPAPQSQKASSDKGKRAPGSGIS